MDREFFVFVGNEGSWFVSCFMSVGCISKLLTVYLGVDKSDKLVYYKH